MMKHFFITTLLSFSLTLGGYSQNVQDSKKIKDIIIYEDSQFYSSFPSVIQRSNKEFYVGQIKNFMSLSEGHRIGKYLVKKETTIQTRIAIWLWYVQRMVKIGQKSQS